MLVLGDLYWEVDVTHLGDPGEQWSILDSAGLGIYAWDSWWPGCPVLLQGPHLSLAGQAELLLCSLLSSSLRLCVCIPCWKPWGWGGSTPNRGHRPVSLIPELARASSLVRATGEPPMRGQPGSRGQGS